MLSKQHDRCRDGIGSSKMVVAVGHIDHLTIYMTSHAMRRSADDSRLWVIIKMACRTGAADHGSQLEDMGYEW